MCVPRFLPFLAVPLLLCACQTADPTAPTEADRAPRSSSALPSRTTNPADSAHAATFSGGLMFGSGT